MGIHPPCEVQVAPPSVSIPVPQAEQMPAIVHFGSTMHLHCRRFTLAYTRRGLPGEGEDDACGFDSALCERTCLGGPQGNSNATDRTCNASKRSNNEKCLRCVRLGLPFRDGDPGAGGPEQASCGVHTHAALHDFWRVTPQV